MDPHRCALNGYLKGCINLKFSRLLRGFVISTATSLPFFLLISLNIVGDTQAVPLFLSALSALLFFSLNASAMRRHLQSVDELKSYFVTELVTFALQLIVCELLIFGSAGNAYAALYMPVMLPETLGMSRLSAIIPVFALYLALIFVFPVERDLEYRRIMAELGEDEDGEEEEDEDEEEDE